MSGVSTAKSLEGNVIGMGFTIGVASISQWRGLRGVDHELCKRGRRARDLVDGSPQCGPGQSKHEIEYNF